MTTQHRIIRVQSLLAGLASLVGVLAGPAVAAPPERPAPAPVVVTDRADDVGQRKLDIRRVVVRNTEHALVVRVVFPGLEESYDFPLGYVAVFLDTDRRRAGAEYGHYLQFWSDYVFAPVRGWRQQPDPAWQHSPDGACVADAGLRSDRGNKLKYMEFVLRKHDGCFEAGAVRVAVSTFNEGENHPIRYYDHPYWDHLGARHSWTRWVGVS